MDISRARGFTLIELLLVIGITTFLFAALLLVLNPAELLRQARDSNRISDLAVLRSALDLYLSDVSNSSLAPSYQTCFLTFATSSCAFGFGGNYSIATSSVIRLTDGTGWLPVNFRSVNTGSPIGTLPIDPVNDASHFYGYAATTTASGFKLVASGIESVKYGQGGIRDAVSNDGGNFLNIYEVGSNPKL